MQRFLLILFSAGAHALAFPPWNLTPIAFIALVPFLRALRGLRPRGGFGAGLLWGTAAIWVIGHWVPGALAFYYQQPLWFGVLFSLGASVVLAGSYYAGFAATACWLSSRTSGTARALLLSALWVSWELARARLLTGDPWLLLGYSLIRSPALIQVADIGGVYLLSFVVVFVNATIAELLPPLGRPMRSVARLLAPAVCLLVAVYAYGTWRLSQVLPHEPAIPVVVVQGNNDLGSQWQAEFYGRGLQHYLDLSSSAVRNQGASVIIWPETAVTFFLAREPRYQGLIVQMLQAAGADLIVGAPHFEDRDPALPQFFNSAFYLTAQGEITGRYDKAHLLPFAEYFPLRTIQFLRRRFERVRSFTPGAGTTLLDTRLGKVATVICFEAIFPEIVRSQMALGADLLVNLSNDVWLGAGAGPQQHLAMVALRAVENRTWVVRATTTGISAVIDPRGRIVSRTESLTSAVLREEIVPLRITTTYKRFGDVFAYACLCASVWAITVLALAGNSREADVSISRLGAG